MEKKWCYICPIWRKSAWRMTSCPGPCPEEAYVEGDERASLAKIRRGVLKGGFGPMSSVVAASLRGRLQPPLWWLQSGIFTTQSRSLNLSAGGLVDWARPAESYKNRARLSAKIRNSPPTSGTSPGDHPLCTICGEAWILLFACPRTGSR